MLPQGPDRRTWARLAFAFLFLFSAFVAKAQVVDFADGRVPMADLKGPWRFHVGDDPSWANPDTPDSDWSLLNAGKPWDEQGHKGYSGVAWYRLRVMHADDAGPLGFYLPAVNDSCQVFVNGRQIGQVGGLPPQIKIVFAGNIFFRIPDAAVMPHQPISIAIRVWHTDWADPNAGGLISVPRVGNAAIIAQWRQYELHHIFTVNGFAFTEIFLDFLTALAGIGLFLLRSKEREYLWWGLAQTFWTVFAVLLAVSNFRPISYLGYWLPFLMCYTLARFCELEFFTTFLRLPRRWLYWSYIVLLLIMALRYVAVATLPISATWAWLGAVASLTEALIQSCFCIMLLKRSGKSNSDANFLLIACGVVLFQYAAQLADALPALGRIGWFHSFARFLATPIHWPFAYGNISLLQMLAVLVILVRRFARSRRDEERLEAELEAARVVQQVLVPEEIPEIAGFAVEAIYKPAGQVGGDFFQIIPAGEGGALIVIGDVSGKGMPAAMTVSLLVGTVRTLAHYTQSPGEILSAMNQRMLARSKDGFTTCMVARVDADGRVTAANAGHLAPYVDGREVPMTNGLPLGLVAGVEYEETEFRLAPGAQLTLMTDGVVEAQSKTRELFGFERSAALATGHADRIAEAAVAFGQQDDVTVVTVRRVPATVPQPLPVLGLTPTEA